MTNKSQAFIDCKDYTIPDNILFSFFGTYLWKFVLIDFLIMTIIKWQVVSLFNNCSIFLTIFSDWWTVVYVSLSRTNLVDQLNVILEAFSRNYHDTWVRFIIRNDNIIIKRSGFIYKAGFLLISERPFPFEYICAIFCKLSNMSMN